MNYTNNLLFFTDNFHYPGDLKIFNINNKVAHHAVKGTGPLLLTQNRDSPLSEYLSIHFRVAGDQLVGREFAEGALGSGLT
jgi:hypothetical protein